MPEDQDAWDELLTAGVLHAMRQAHTEATLAVFGGLSRAAGFTDRSYGFASFDVLASQLDRVFAADGAPVSRDDLNGSPGWRYGRFRMLLKRHEFGAVRAIRWDRDSPTKQTVAHQDFPDDPQLTLDLGVLRRRPSEARTVTLVLAHSASEEPLEMELFLGRPRLNNDGGPAWHWLRALTDETLGADPRRRPAQPALWTDEDERAAESDVPLRLHRRDIAR